jgi:penicillin-binding protein 1C
LGLTTLFRPANEYGLPLILGGAEVTLFEITKLYAALGRATDPSSKDSKLISSGAAWLTLEALVNAARPGEESIWREYAGARHIAWKTGTSYGFRDAWAVGVTPEWTVGVWIGNATGEGRPELRSAVTSAPVLFEIFSVLSSIGGNRNTWFGKPAKELQQAEICASSGFPASVNCADTKYVDIPKDAPAAKPCRFCQTIILDATLTYRIVLGSGVSTTAVEQKWFVLPPAEEWYYRRWNLDYKPLPPFLNSKDLLNRGEGVLALFNPEPDSKVYVPRELDNSEGKIVFSAAHRDEAEIIYWHLDDVFLGYTQTFHEMEARPLPGVRTLTLVDSKGNMIVRRFTVLEGK